MLSHSILICNALIACIPGQRDSDVHLAEQHCPRPTVINRPFLVQEFSCDALGVDDQHRRPEEPRKDGVTYQQLSENAARSSRSEMCIP